MLMEEKIVAICIPVYEHKELLERALDSIFAQSFDDYVVVITDDSKSDEIGSYVKELNNKKIIYKKNKKSKGTSGNVNVALKIALSLNVNYIKILFQDDWFSDKEALKKMIAYMDETEADVVFVGNYECYASSRNTRVCEKEDVCRLQEDISNLFRGNILGAPSNIVYKTREFFFDSRFTWLLDLDFYFNILSSNSFEYVYEPLISIGHDGDQLTDFYNIHPYKKLVEVKRLYRKYKYIHSKKNRSYIINMEKQFIKKCLRGVIGKN